jgi:glycosyltransferase involved in cell wall biosynthesis
MDNSNQPLITIITPVYNGEAYLESLILSIRQQWAADLEYLVIDDGSSDRTPHILKNHPNIRWWSRDNRGQYTTMNEGLAKASGQYICFISADDLIYPDAINEVREAIKNHQFPDGIYGKTLLINEDGTPYAVQSVTAGGAWFQKYLGNVAHCSLYIKKDFLLQNQLNFDAALKYSGDYDWIIRIFQQNPRLIHINRYLAQVRIHHAQSSVRFQENALEEQKRVHQKYHINQKLINFIELLLTLRSAFLRLVWEWRHHGWNSFMQLLVYFVKRKI